jgi:hypothetical protein
VVWHLIQQRRKPLGWAVTLAVAAVVVGWPWAAAQAPLTWSQNVPGNSKPIMLYADAITTWMEQGSRVILLKGRVWIEHGIVQIQLPQGIVWVDDAKKQRTGIYQVDLFADGPVNLEDGPNSYSGLKGHIELNTRGEIRLKAYSGKVEQTPNPADPLYLRAVAAKFNLAAAAAKPAPPAPATVRPALAAAAPAPKVVPGVPLQEVAPPPGVPRSVQPVAYPPPPPVAPPASSAAYGPPPAAGAPARAAIFGQPILSAPSAVPPAGPAPMPARGQLGLPE